MVNNRISRTLIPAAIAAVVLVCALGANSAFAAPQTAPRIQKFHGIVVTANIGGMLVRDPKNPQHPMSFSYSPVVRDRMVKILTAGGFQYGDKVTVEYAQGTTVALKLHGKPSKPKTPPPMTQAPQKSQ